MSDNSASPVPAELARIRSSLEDCGYAITDEVSIGLPENFRDKFGQAYFNSETLRHDEGDWPIDRERARDVVFYQRRGDDLELHEFETITLTDRAGVEGKRDHARVRLLSDVIAQQFIRTVLAFVPGRIRQEEGTFGINLFRTYTNVVTIPHHDHEQFIITYVIDRIGEGAETYLYRPEDVHADGEIVGKPVLRQQLNPGQMIIFEDKKYKHGATPLVPPPDAS
ncbi:MAG TPA: 2OG-Fe dioxygenase family protein, partial [Streptosporangiaceae bacterium]